ncbi:hypothetical protein E8D34_10450 [Nocardioides sp. GY 10113]|uniref:hypothetical protein n=1 Tax=Nocardioides sp. GY 10113 TaxID=2569761 RepID=UPI0010A7699C|nr:hypothetical protein [Nocardioides sp. GY 10113]TIC87525.1 hypothetical protein E8D34_10450 [Nocardioides sp. GY 10113]
MRRPGYADIASTLALFLAVSTGGAYAAGLITGKDIKNDSVRSADVAGLKVKDTAKNFLPGARMEAGTVPLNGSNNAVDMSVQGYDVGGLYTPGDDRIVVKQAGRYAVKGSICWGSGTDDGGSDIAIVVNGEVKLFSGQDNPGAGYRNQDVGEVLKLAKGDSVELFYWNYGANTNTCSWIAGPQAYLEVQMISR